MIVVVGGFIYFDSSNVRCLRRHGDVLGSGFRGFPSDVDASENVTANCPLLICCDSRTRCEFDFRYLFFKFYFDLFSRSKWSSMGLMLVFDRCGYLTVSSEFQTVSSGYFHRHGRGNQFEGAYSIPVWHALCAYIWCMYSTW